MDPFERSTGEPRRAGGKQEQGLRSLLQGRGEQAQRLIPGTASVSDADTDTLCPQSRAVAAPAATGPGMEGGRIPLGMEEL